MNTTACPECGVHFACCPQPEQRCWCLDLPPLPAERLSRDAGGCFCPDCLRERLAALPGADAPLGGAA